MRKGTNFIEVNVETQIIKWTSFVLKFCRKKMRWYELNVSSQCEMSTEECRNWTLWSNGTFSDPFEISDTISIKWIKSLTFTEVMNILTAFASPHRRLFNFCINKTFLVDNIISKLHFTCWHFNEIEICANIYDECMCMMWYDMISYQFQEVSWFHLLISFCLVERN